MAWRNHQDFSKRRCGPPPFHDFYSCLGGRWASITFLKSWCYRGGPETWDRGTQCFFSGGDCRGNIPPPKKVYEISHKWLTTE